MNKDKDVLTNQTIVRFEDGELFETTDSYLSLIHI